jgi:hypothetical protein
MAAHATSSGVTSTSFVAKDARLGSNQTVMRFWLRVDQGATAW